MLEIEVSVRDAQAANEIIRDLPLDAGDYSQPYSNIWIFGHKDIAEEVVEFLEVHNIEIL